MASEKKCSTRASQDPIPVPDAVVLDAIHSIPSLDGWHAIPGWGGAYTRDRSEPPRSPGGHRRFNHLVRNLIRQGHIRLSQRSRPAPRPRAHSVARAHRSPACLRRATADSGGSDGDGGSGSDPDPDAREIHYHGAHYRIESTNIHRTRRGVSVSSTTLATVSTDPAKRTTQKFVSYLTPSQTTDSTHKKHGVISRLGVPKALMTPSPRLGTPQAPLLVGFDAEWQVVDGRRQILSVQMSVRCSDSLERVWVLWHRKNTRFKLATVLGWFLSDLAPYINYRDFVPVGDKKQKGSKKGKNRNNGGESPYLITLAGHYSIVDLSVVYDRAKILRKTDSLRRTLASVEKPVYSEVWSEDRNRSRKVVIHFRDTMLLAPAGSSVEKLGDAMQFPKLVLPDGYSKSEMGRLRAERPDAFIAYAARDAEITRRWIEMTTGPNSIVPVTLGGQAAVIVRETIMAQRMWSRTQFDSEWRGLASTAESYSDGDGATLRRRKVLVPRDEAALLLTAANHAYYGGRNEGFLFGIHHAESGWSDFDLAGAYPTAMCLIDDPDYKKASAITGTLWPGMLKPNSWFFGHVRFRFPDGTMYPCLPVKDSFGRGLIFPLEGETWASSPELWLALQIGCEIELMQPALLMGTTGHFSLKEGVRSMVRARREAEQTYGKKSVQALAAKERVNSAYGKLAQGLAGKRAYSTRHDQTRPIPMSPITSAPQAALTTGLVRAVVSAAMIQMNKLGYSIASVTTDGFLTDAPADVLTNLDLFGLRKGFEDARHALLGSETIWELKHRSRSLVMLKTRGGFGVGQIDEHALPVAGAGYKVSGAVKERVEQIGKPEALAELFLARKGRVGFEFHALPSPREYIKRDADAVGRDVSKQISWEWDYKREPVNERMESIEIDGTRYNHVSYATRPWRNMAGFENARAATDDLHEPVVNERNVGEIRGRISRRPAAKAMGMRVRGKLARANAVSILRGLRSGLLSASWYGHGVTGRQVCMRVGEAFGVELGANDWKNAGRADRSQKALFIGLAVEMAALGVVVSTAPAVKTAREGSGSHSKSTP